MVPNIDDPQMLFLANNISKMKTGTELGSRIIEVHNGSSLFTGKAGQGPSNLRRYIFEQDLCEAIIAIPENMFYNTGIGTYIWVLTNRKEERRKGKVQLIDATSMKSTLRKNLGDKNCEMTSEIREQVMKLYLAFEDADPEFSKVFPNAEFGYLQVDVNRPLKLKVDINAETLAAFKADGKDEEFYNFLVEYAGNGISSMDYNQTIVDMEKAVKKAGLKWSKKRQEAIRKFFTTVNENAAVVLDKNGEPEADTNLKDSEQIPLLYEGGIEGFFKNEIEPYVPDAKIDEDSAIVGYELSFTKYFYKPVQLRDVADIIADIRAIEQSTDGLLASIIGGEV